MKMTESEKCTNYETMLHIRTVGHLINEVIRLLLERAEEHDQTKLEEPELAIFTEYTPKLAATTYGSEEYNKYLQEMSVALEHHYANNRHHPQHHPDGIDGMTLIDLVEMFCDWKAASTRHNNGNLLKSIEINSARFNMSDQLVKIFGNTAKLLD